MRRTNAASPSEAWQACLSIDDRDVGDGNTLWGLDLSRRLLLRPRSACTKQQDQKSSGRNAWWSLEMRPFGRTTQTRA
jgi:hypothetical protein